MWKWRKADWIWFVAMWVPLTLIMLVANHYGKLTAEPKIFWIVCFPPFISWLMVLHDKARERKLILRNKKRLFTRVRRQP